MNIDMVTKARDSAMNIQIGDVFILQDGIEAGDGGPDTIYFPESCEVVCEEIRKNDILLEISL